MGNRDHTINLDCDAPENVAIELQNLAQYMRKMADEYRGSSGDLAAAWQDSDAGKIWISKAKTLEKLATHIDKIVRMSN